MLRQPSFSADWLGIEERVLDLVLKHERPQLKRPLLVLDDDIKTLSQRSEDPLGLCNLHGYEVGFCFELGQVQRWQLQVLEPEYLLHHVEVPFDSTLGDCKLG